MDLEDVMMKKCIAMTGKEIAALANEGKLIEYQCGPRKVWKKGKKKWYLEKLTDPDNLFCYSLVLYLNPNGIYEIIDGMQRISILLDYLKNARVEELKRVEDKKLVVEIITEATADELKNTRRIINTLTRMVEA
jgi:hypothetical protein